MDWTTLLLSLAILFFIYELVRFGIRVLIYTIVRINHHRRDS